MVMVCLGFPEVSQSRLEKGVSWLMLQENIFIPGSRIY